MKLVIQRVKKASVTVDDKVISSIGKGLCVLVGIHKSDTSKQVDYLSRKLLNFRLFEDDKGNRWSNSVTEEKLEILCVSQFTLYYTLKGNKPDFRAAMPGQDSKKLYDEFLEKVKSGYDSDKIKDGQFGAVMSVEIINDGPVTMELEARNDDK